MLATGAAAPAALAHPAREERPGAPQLDLEVLVPPPLDDQLTPGATDADVSVDGFGNRFTVALKELPASPDTRAPRPARTAAWRWVSIDRGDSWDNVDVLPARADLLLPPASSVAVASDGPLTVLAEDHGGVVRVQPVVSAGLGRFAAGTPGAVTTAVSRPVDVVLRGKTVLLLAGHPSGDYAVYRSTDGGSTFSLGTVLRDVTGCSLAADPRPTAKVVVASCTRGEQVVVDVSTDSGASFTRRPVGRADARTPDRSASVDVAPDGRLVVLSGMRMFVSRDAGRRWSGQDLQVERGEYRSSTLAVSPRGRVGVAAYRRTAPGEAWTVVTTIFTPGKRPVLSDFTAHDPVAPVGATAPPSRRTSLDFATDGTMQLVWSSTHLHSRDLDRPVLRNVWSIRSNST